MLLLHPIRLLDTSEYVLEIQILYISFKQVANIGFGRTHIGLSRKKFSVSKLSILRNSLAITTNFFFFQHLNKRAKVRKKEFGQKKIFHGSKSPCSQYLRSNKCNELPRNCLFHRCKIVRILHPFRGLRSEQSYIFRLLQQKRSQILKIKEL